MYLEDDGNDDDDDDDDNDDNAGNDDDDAGNDFTLQFREIQCFQCYTTPTSHMTLPCRYMKTRSFSTDIVNAD